MITYNVKSSLIMTHTIFNQGLLKHAFEENGIDNTNLDWTINKLEVIASCDSGIINMNTLIDELKVIASLGVSGTIAIDDDHCNHKLFRLGCGVIITFTGEVVFKVDEIINIR